MHFKRGTKAAWLAALLVLAAAYSAPSSSAQETPACTVQDGLGSFDSPLAVPGACWRPYADSSPFNRVIPKRARRALRSKAIVKQLRKGGSVSSLVVGNPARDAGNATYYSEASDPLFVLHCTEASYGRCPIKGMSIRVPDQALPAGGAASLGHETDAHMTVVDQASGWEYDMWSVRAKPPGGGRLDFGWGGRTRIDGDGLGSGATSAHFGNLAGIIRGPELAAGYIPHALAMFVPCIHGAVYPAFPGGISCPTAGLGSRAAPAEGARFQLRVSPRTIRRMHLPAWKRAVALALIRYGAYVSDTSAAADQWGFEVESGFTYTSFGLEDPMVSLAQQLGLPSIDSGNGQRAHVFDLSRGVPWRKLRIVRP